MEDRTLNGSAVKALREALNVPASELAIECLMSPGQFSNIEASRKTASVDATRRIITALERRYPAPAHHRATPVNLTLALTFPTNGAAA